MSNNIPPPPIPVRKMTQSSQMRFGICFGGNISTLDLEVLFDSQGFCPHLQPRIGIKVIKGQNYLKHRNIALVILLRCPYPKWRS